MAKMDGRMGSNRNSRSNAIACHVMRANMRILEWQSFELSYNIHFNLLYNSTFQKLINSLSKRKHPPNKFHTCDICN